MAFEQQYLTSLATVADYSIAGQTLSLLDASGTAVLVFEAGAPATIEGAWVVTGYNNGKQGVETPPDELGLTADFAPRRDHLGQRRLQHLRWRLQLYRDDDRDRAPALHDDVLRRIRRQHRAAIPHRAPGRDRVVHHQRRLRAA